MEQTNVKEKERQIPGKGKEEEQEKGSETHVTRLQACRIRLKYIVRLCLQVWPILGQYIMGHGRDMVESHVESEVIRARWYTMWSRSSNTAAIV